MGPALARPLGTVFAVDLVKHGGRYFIYIPFKATQMSTDKGNIRMFVQHVVSGVYLIFVRWKLRV